MGYFSIMKYICYRKITMGLVKIKLGLQKINFRNIYAIYWGHAKDYVEAQWLILQQKS